MKQYLPKTDRPCPNELSQSVCGSQNLPEGDAVTQLVVGAQNKPEEGEVSQSHIADFALPSTSFVSPESIRPFPKAPPLKENSQRSRKKGKTRILTDTPEKKDVEATRKRIPAKETSFKQKTGIKQDISKHRSPKPRKARKNVALQFFFEEQENFAYFSESDEEFNIDEHLKSLKK